MRTRLKRLLMVVATIVMATQCFALGQGDELKALDNTYHLLFQVKDPVNQTVVAMATNQTTGDIVVPYEVQDQTTEGTKTYYVVSVDRFTNASNLTSVKLSEGIKTIEKGCFGRCYDLTKVEIPASVETIGDGVFTMCSSLSTVTVADDNQNFAVEDGLLYNKAKTELIYYPMAKTDETVTLASTLTEVKGGAFSGNTSLKKIILSTALEKFDATAVFGCTSLEAYEISDENEKFSTKDGLLCSKDGATLQSVPYTKASGAFTVPAGITTIAANAFYNTDKLSSIDLGQVVTLEENAFYRCNLLQEVTIPATATNVPSTTFASCTKLKNIKVAEGNANYVDVDGVLFDKDKTTLLAYPISHSTDDDEYTTMPNTVTTIAKGAFNACHIKKVVFANSVKKIENDAFSYSTISEVELNEGLEEIGQGAFSASDLSSLHIPASVKKIERMAFYKLNSNTTPGFVSKNHFTGVTVADGSQLEYIVDAAFGSNSYLESFTFNGSTTINKIGANVFNNCKALTSFDVPASVARLDNGAFSGCEELENINFANDSKLTILGEQAFQDCSKLTHVELPSSVTTIKKEAFNKCTGLTQIDIPAATNDIDYSAFQFCNNLTKINVNADNAKYASVDGMLASKDQKTLVIFPAGKANDKITLLSPAFTAIGDYAFYNCQKLTNVTIPKHVESFGKNAFGLCDHLNTIAFLGDKPISLAAKTNQANDTYAFLGTGNADILAKCTICVRKGQEGAYAADESFWSTYAKNIITSFKEENSKFQSDNGENEYEEYFPMSDNAVSLLTTTSTAHTLVIPASVKTTINGTEKTYNVNMIGDYAFEDTKPAIKEVVLKGNIIYIGSWAFNKNKHTGDQSAAKPAATVEADNQIKNIFFLDKEQTGTELSTKRFGLDAANFNGIYNEFLTGQNIYVRKSVYDKVNEDVNNSTWGQYASKLAYKIPLSFSTTYSTLSREFDVDMSADNWSDAKNSPKVIAFTSGKYKKLERPNKDNYYYVRMTSINVGAEKGDGTYIPANTGVLLKNADGSELKDFYYQIYDQEEAIPAAPTDNLMQAVVERDGMLNSPKKDENYKYYDFGLGADDLLHRYMGTNGKTVDVHTSYLKLSQEDYEAVNPADPSAVKLCMVFDLDGSTTGIEDVKTDGQKNIDNDAYYTLQGVKVAHPTKGIYVHGGKKVVIK